MDVEKYQRHRESPISEPAGGFVKEIWRKHNLQIMRTFIYALYDPRFPESEPEIRYIGKTANPKPRLDAHIISAKRKRTHKENWISQLQAEGLQPVMIILEEVEGDGCKEEIEAISLARQAGFRLTNGTDGGDGAIGHKDSPETRVKRSAAARLRRHSAETKAKMSTTRKLYWASHEHSAEHKAKVSEARKGKTHSAETKAKISEAMKHQWESREHKAKISAGNVGKKHSAETKAKISEAAKLRWAAARTDTFVIRNRINLIGRPSL